jgi:hypothetical protein
VNNIGAWLIVAATAVALHSFTYPQTERAPCTDPEPECVDSSLRVTFGKQYLNLFAGHHNRFRELTDSFYKILCCDETKPSKVVFENGFRGYLYLLSRNQLLNPFYLSLIDYSLSANVKRLWIIDMRQMDVIYTELVSHGRNTGEEYATHFSNKPESYQSSLGFFITGENYIGRNGISMRLFGIEKYINHLAFERAIVMHGADYVSQSFILENKRLGRSLGCPAVGTDVAAPIIETIENGSCMYAYHPQKKYNKNSTILNASFSSMIR